MEGTSSIGGLPNRAMGGREQPSVTWSFPSGCPTFVCMYEVGMYVCTYIRASYPTRVSEDCYLGT